MTCEPESVKAGTGGNFAQHPARLRWRRVAAGLGLNEAARRAGISKGHLSKMEHGLEGASANALAQLAKVYGCEITALMPDEPDGAVA